MWLTILSSQNHTPVAYLQARSQRSFMHKRIEQICMCVNERARFEYLRLNYWPICRTTSNGDAYLTSDLQNIELPEGWRQVRILMLRFRHHEVNRESLRALCCCTWSYETLLFRTTIVIGDLPQMTFQRLQMIFVAEVT